MDITQELRGVILYIEKKYSVDSENIICEYGGYETTWYKRDRNKNKINLYDKLVLVKKIDMFFEVCTCRPQSEYSYAVFNQETNKIDVNANMRAQKMKVISGSHPDKETIIGYAFALDLPIKICNQLLHAKQQDGLYSRNINEGLAIYYLNKNTEDTCKSLEELFNDYYQYRYLIHKYEKFTIATLGKEFECIYYEIDEDSSTAKDGVISVNRRKFPSIFKSGKKEKNTLQNIVKIMTDSIKTYEKASEAENYHAKTTHYMFEKITDTHNLDELEDLIHRESSIWCRHRNRPIKELIKLITEAYSKDITFSKFAQEIFDFYYCKPDYVLIRKNSQITDGEKEAVGIADNDNGELVKTGDIFRSVQFARDVKNIFFSISPMTRNAYITLLVFLYYKNKRIISIEDLDRYLTDVGYSPLAGYDSDEFIKAWLNKCKKVTDMQKNLGATFKDNKDKCFDAQGNFIFSPIAWK